MSLVLRADKGSILTYQELDGNFTYLLSEIVRVEGLTDGSTSVKFTNQTLTELQQDQVRQNIAAADIKLASLPSDLTASEREAIRLKLGIEENNPLAGISIKHIEIDANAYEVDVMDYSTIIVDFYTTPYDRVVVLPGTIDGQELIIRTGNFTAAPTVKINIPVLNENGVDVWDITMDKNSVQKFYWIASRWILI